MPATSTFRTAIFVVHNPTRHVRTVLERAFRDYTHAYTTLLHAFEHLSLDELRGLATARLDAQGRPRMSAQKLVQGLFQRDLPPSAASALVALESGLREAVRIQVAETLMSYVALAEIAAASGDPALTPSYPSRLRAASVEPLRHKALAEAVTIADDARHVRQLVTDLQRTRQPGVIPLRFPRIEPTRNCGLFYNPETRRFYARLFVVSPESHYARPITMRGQYVDVRSGAIYQADERKQETMTANEDGDHQSKAAGAMASSFGRGVRSLLVPLELGRYHETALRWLTPPTAFLPQRMDTRSVLPAAPGPQAAEPVTAKLVRRTRRRRGREDNVRYELHVSFRVPVPERVPETRALVAINRGIRHLYSAVVTSPDARTVLEATAASGVELRRVQETLERMRQVRQQRGKVVAADRRQSRIAENHVALCANEIVALAQRHQAQVVFESLSSFATGQAIRTIRAHPAAHRAVLRRLLNRRQFEAIRDAVDMRLELIGLPPSREVPSAFISLSCPSCGHIAGANRDRDDPGTFVCERCGARGDTDSVAALNIARKLLWLNVRASEAKGELASEQRTTWAAFAQTFAAAPHPVGVL